MSDTENMDPELSSDSDEDEFVNEELENRKNQSVTTVKDMWSSEKNHLRESLKASLEVLLQKTGAWTAIVAKRLKDLDKEMKKHGQAGLQPKLIENGQLRSYQLEGVRWMETLFANGLNGILGDEMGLGKTLQTIAFLASLVEKGISGPFLVVAPLSVVSNWKCEFARFAPRVPTIVYHGDKIARKELLEARARQIGDDGLVVLTSYEMIIRDATTLELYPWKYIIIDEGHRIKNLHCRLVEQLKTLQSANRLLLTGTPLQNSLTELWSLLHFLEPSLFSDISYFQAWFDFDDLQAKRGQERVLDAEIQHHLVTKLHTILRPFLLRRTKDCIEQKLPPKREYLLYAPLSQLQRKLYNAIVQKNLGPFLQGVIKSYFESIRQRVDSSGPKSRAKTIDAFFKRKAPQNVHRRAKRVASGLLREVEEWELSDTEDGANNLAEDETEDWTEAKARKMVNRLNLQNTLMQIRKCVNHPYLFVDPGDVFDFLDEPYQSRAKQSSYAWASPQQLLESSGKMLVLDQLLDKLLSEGQRVLIFSQMTQMLWILTRYLERKKVKFCTLVGSTSLEERQNSIIEFNKPDSPLQVFLLSTRAGGLGVNLATADTVVLFDSDWNPQQDLQAQDRVHRIGQTKPVIVYRLVARDTAEARILERASGKRKLEALVIQKGGYVFSREEEEKLKDANSEGVTAHEASSGSQGNDFKDLINRLSMQKGKTWLSNFPVDELQSILQATVYTDPQASLLEPSMTMKKLRVEELAEICDRSPQAYERCRKHPELCLGESFQAVDLT